MESLFAQERSGMMGRTYLWGFLEALQRLAWLPEFFASVLDILARLAKLDPGGQWGPRPVAVMQRILHPCGAHTTVGAPMRLDVVSALLKKYPEQLWDVLVSLLPSGGYRMFLSQKHSTNSTDTKHWPSGCVEPIRTG